MKSTIMFEFAGRRANMELQRPFFERILADRPDVELHVWNLAKDPDDAEYIKDYDEDHPRIIVHNEFYGKDPWTRFNDVYRHYAQPKYKACRFVKLDDDVVFLETREFGSFIDAIDQNPQAVMSANVINNGACMHLDPLLFGRFKSLHIPLLDVHKYPQFAEMSHEYFFEHWRELTNQEPRWTPTTDWLSINLIGYDYGMAREFASLLDTPHPRVVAGRSFRGRDRVGDEGMVNMLPRIVVQGFTAAHLTFGPQERKAPDMWPGLRKRYAEVGREYLDATL